MKDPFFTFIVPIYNAEKYLQTCLDSIRKQTFGLFDVIMIDDGSTDGSAAIAEVFANKDSRFHLFCQENKGTSGATNAGLSRAKGKYIINLDNDDYVGPCLLEEAYRIIEKHHPDIIQFQSNFVDEAGAELRKQSFYEEEIFFSGNENLYKCEKIMPGSFNRTHSRKIFRRNLLEGIWFEGNSKGADTSFLRCVLLRANKVVLSPRQLFFVREVATSESRKPNPPYLYKEWIDREIKAIDFCIKENDVFQRERPLWMFSDLIDMWQLFSAKAIKEGSFDKTYFKKAGKAIWKRKAYLVPRGIKNRVKWFVWLHFAKPLASVLSKKIPDGDFIV